MAARKTGTQRAQSTEAVTAGSVSGAASAVTSASFPAHGVGEQPDESRWKQRRENFARSMDSLGRACELDDYSELERAGLIQMFEVAFELAWKTLKDLLYYEGYDAASPREVLRQAFVAGHTTEAEATVLLDALTKRNLLSHTYSEATAEQAVAAIREQYAPALHSLLLHLSRKADA